ncbi:MAG: alginate export family protein [Candidatus Omnitrophica bacterium]|nr:alginate export family protein [Candidatus Omnitrophota bacterium]
MKKFIVIALMMVLSSPAFAAVQNVKVSGDITTSFVGRNDFDLGLNQAGVGVGLKNQNIFLTQTRLRVDADLTDNVSTTIGLINERVWNAENSSDSAGKTNYANDTNVQLYLASVTLREFLYSPLSVTIGRQLFHYGNGLVISDNSYLQNSGSLEYITKDLSMRKGLDGVKAVLDYKPLTIDLVYIKHAQSNNSIRGLAGLESGQGSDIYGYNANYQLNDAWNTVLEQYVFIGVQGKAYVGAQDKGEKWFIPGFHVSTNPIKGLNLQGELALQMGDQIIDDSGSETAEPRHAMAAQLMATYSLPVLTKYKPTLNASYTYLSGDKMANRNYSGSGSKDAKRYTAWDPFMGDVGAGTIYGTLFAASNMNIFSAGASVSPIEDVTTSFTWTNLLAADAYNLTNNPLDMFQPNSGLSVYNPVTKANRRGLGNEYDVNVKYDYTEDVSFGATVGWYIPGDALANTNRDTASQAIANVAVKF